MCKVHLYRVRTTYLFDQYDMRLRKVIDRYLSVLKVNRFIKADNSSQSAHGFLCGSSSDTVMFDRVFSVSKDADSSSGLGRMGSGDRRDAGGRHERSDGGCEFPWMNAQVVGQLLDPILQDDGVVCAPRRVRWRRHRLCRVLSPQQVDPTSSLALPLRQPPSVEQSHEEGG